MTATPTKHRTDGKPNVMPKSNSIMDYLDFKQPIALSGCDELVAKLDNEALLTKFLDINAKFIVVGPLHQQIQKLEYSQLRDELCRIDVDIRHRVLIERVLSMRRGHVRRYTTYTASCSKTR